MPPMAVSQRRLKNFLHVSPVKANEYSKKIAATKMYSI
jgi:hypothetical protein